MSKRWQLVEAVRAAWDELVSALLSELRLALVCGDVPTHLKNFLTLAGGVVLP